MTDYLPFATAYVAAAATPGVESATIMSYVLAKRSRDVVPLAIGLLTGKVVILLVALIGATALALLLGPWFAALRYAGALWLAWMAIGRLRRAAGSGTALPTPRNARSAVATFGLGVALTLGNPVAMTFYFAVLPSVVPHSAPMDATIPLIFIVLTVMSVVVTSYGLLAHLLRGALKARPRVVDVIGGGMLFAASVIILVTG